MARGRRLVVGHLEDISWRVLEEYPQVVKEMIRSRAGIYALYNRRKLYYVGLASNLMGRLKQHLKDRHRGVWDRFSVYLTIRDDHMKELESLLLRIVDPVGNKMGGRLSDAKNLRSQLNRLMKETDDDRRARLIGGAVAKRRSRIKASKGFGAKALAGMRDRSLTIKGWRRNWEYAGRLRRDGTISYAGSVYDSPRAAARAALGAKARVNGWTFWHLKNDEGDWVPLKSIKR